MTPCLRLNPRPAMTSSRERLFPVFRVLITRIGSARRRFFGDSEALSNTINLLCRDPARRATMGAAAYERLRRDFGMDRTINLLDARLRAHVRAAPPKALKKVA